VVGGTRCCEDKPSASQLPALERSALMAVRMELTDDRRPADVVICLQMISASDAQSPRSDRCARVMGITVLANYPAQQLFS
jgi:hypothetical protein